MTTNSKKSPILVHNPYNNKVMNVEPLFEFYQLMSASEASEEIVEAIRLITLNAESSLHQEFINSLLGNLFEMRSMFKNLEGCEIAVPKQQNNNLNTK